MQGACCRRRFKNREEFLPFFLQNIYRIMIDMLDIILHKYFKLPYRLNIYSDDKPGASKATVLLLHGMGNSGESWDDLITKLTKSDVGARVISMDLLGFGKSPSPRWLKYDVAIQAKSVIFTLLRAGVRQPLIIVGHSMGSLIAIEITKRYPLLVKALILCSPPIFYTDEDKSHLPFQQRILRKFYKYILKNPQTVVGAAPLVVKLKLANRTFNVTSENVDIYLAALESSIMHQSSLDDAMSIEKPTNIIYGTFDPLIAKKNLKLLAKNNQSVQLSEVASGHEITPAYNAEIIKAIKSLRRSVKKSNKNVYR